MMFNVQGAISSDAINLFSLVQRVFQRIRISSSNAHANPDDVEPAEYAEFLPILTVVVRDFYLDLEKDGKPISPDEYLENVLTLPTGNRPIDRSNRMTLSAIRDSFPSRICFVLPSPVDKEEYLLRLNEIP